MLEFQLGLQMQLNVSFLLQYNGVLKCSFYGDEYVNFAQDGCYSK